MTTIPNIESPIACEIFNKPNQVIEGWYWALPSKELKKKKTHAVTVMGKEIVLYRKPDGSTKAIEAICPHRGAHLKLAKLEADGIRCQYHRWKYNDDGDCVDIPCRKEPVPAKVKHYPCREAYGMVWVYTGTNPKHQIPEVPELEGMEIRTMRGGAYNKPCHPNVVMLDAIDAQHFYSVHHIDTLLDFEITEHHQNCISFANKRPVPKRSWIGKAIDLFYKGPLTFTMTYWNGTSGFVTLGPDFMLFYIMFCNRVGKKGECEGQILLFTKKRKGPLGWLADKAILCSTFLVAKYFAWGDDPVFSSIDYDFKTPIKEDQALLTFIRHTEKQELATW